MVDEYDDDDDYLCAGLGVEAQDAGQLLRDTAGAAVNTRTTPPQLNIRNSDI